MAKSTNIVKRKRGRPIVVGEQGAGVFVGVRLPAALLADAEKWAKRNKIGGRSAAIRALIEKGLKD